MSGVMRLSEVTRGYPEPTRAQMPQNGEKLVFSSSRLNKIFILFNLEEEKRLPRWSRDAVLRIIADEQTFVK